MTDIVFVHGWGFDASFWDQVRAELPEFDTDVVDLGFWGKSKTLKPSAVYVGHSMGFAWVLRNVPEIKGLIAVNGFTKFTQDQDWLNGTAPRLLDRMIRQFERKPETVWIDFMKNCGLKNPDMGSDADLELLRQGLEDLRSWDVRQELNDLEVPVCAIAGSEDQIVSEKLSENSFGLTLNWVKGGNHLLPLQKPQEIADVIRWFMESQT